jgi:hypothetical protein
MTTRPTPPAEKLVYAVLITLLTAVLGLLALLPREALTAKVLYQGF